MDLANIMYRYINRFSNSEELIASLENIDKTKYSKEEIKEIDKLLKDVKEIVSSVPNETDEIETKRIEKIGSVLEAFKRTLEKGNLNAEDTEIVQKHYNSMLKDKEKVRDGGERYEKLFMLLTRHALVGKECMQMEDLELLEFITQYISAPLPPDITQEDFNDLVDAGIKEDKREALWRLAMNYNRKGKDFSKIVDYFIEKRDNYYLAELICGVEEDLDLDAIIDKALQTQDIEFIRKMANTEYLQPIFTEEQKDKVKRFIQKN